jgi:hypothetical protein
MVLEGSDKLIEKKFFRIKEIITLLSIFGLNSKL